jgi:hypothetical protein
LMYHDTRIGEAMPFPLFTGSEEKGSHGCRLTNAICVYRR